MGKRIINGQKMLLMKQLHNKNYLFILASFFLVTHEIGSTEPIYSISKKYEPAQNKISYSKNGMVTTQHFIATKVGEEILSKGGNAYDASIAIAFTLAVVLPRAGNIGGGGFMVMYDNETMQPYSIDYREKAPEKSH